MLLTTVADPAHGDLYHPSAPIAGTPNLGLDVLVLHELGGWALWVVAKLVSHDRSLCMSSLIQTLNPPGGDLAIQPKHGCQGKRCSPSDDVP